MNNDIKTSTSLFGAMERLLKEVVDEQAANPGVTVCKPDLGKVTFSKRPVQFGPMGICIRNG